MHALRPRLVYWAFPKGFPSNATGAPLESRCLAAIARRKVNAKRRPIWVDFRPFSHGRVLSAEESPGQPPSVDDSSEQLLDFVPRRYFYPRDGQTMRVRKDQAIFLRDACTCPLCVDTSTRQRKFQTTHIPEEIDIARLIRQGSQVKIYWKNDIRGFDENHCTTFSDQELWKLQGARKLNRVLRRRKTWTSSGFRPHEIAFQHYMDKEKIFSLGMRHLYTDGILFVTGVPKEDESVKRIASQIGSLRNTFYGETWDVTSQANASNVAYTSEKLDFHMDLLYMSEPPSLQFLHCMDNSCPGGSSRFVDTFAAAHMLKAKHPLYYQKLAGSALTFQYENRGHHYTRQVPALQLSRPAAELLRARLAETNPSLVVHGRERETQKYSHSFLSGMEADAAADAARSYLKGHYIDELRAVNWSPLFQGPLPASTPKVNFMLRALSVFRGMLERKEFGHERKVEPGTCVIVDNRRIAHARDAFHMMPGAERRLRGAYLDSDEFVSCCEELWKRDREIWEDAVDFDEPKSGFIKRITRAGSATEQTSNPEANLLQEADPDAIKKYKTSPAQTVNRNADRVREPSSSKLEPEPDSSATSTYRPFF